MENLLEKDAKLVSMYFSVMFSINIATNDASY